MATVSVALASPVSAGAVRSSRSPCKQQAAAIPAFASRKRLQRLQRHGVRAAAASTAGSFAEPPSATVPISRQLPEADERFGGLKVLVAGATGGVGKAVVQQLAAQGIPVRALVRDGVKAAGMLPAAGQGGGVEIVEGDVYKFTTVAKALQGCNAVICATGPTDRLNPLGPFTVDCEGTKNLVAAAQQQGVKKFVHVTSIGCDDPLFPLNAYWGVLFWKKQGEVALQRSGIDYTIVRPGGLLNEPRSGQKVGHVVMEGPDAFGLPPRKRPGSILRTQVAEVCVAALVEPSASGKVVEIIAEENAPARPLTELFASV
ncbi:hypothetical protein COHA_004076 [Chlorella ohadii]|uniref:NAD(P)-binding domain-containing protein n=1 Tax=Chlorella ohadii TaxID=2649997 RepID=A0AAD5H7L0_9CHLO|nr:hypothetical protein COHA_004076 [Chlorella ohadii]